MKNRFSKILICLSIFSISCASQPYPKSDHYDGRKFFNPGLADTKGFLDFLKWQMQGGKTPWPDFRPLRAVPKVAKQVKAGQLSTTFINHATHLIQFEKINVLTDPIFSERASPLQWLGPKRVHPPALSIKDLPQVHVVVISHNHYDHMDKTSIRDLTNFHDPLFIVPLANKALLAKLGARRILELDWWQEHHLPQFGMLITLVPSQHWCARGLFDRNESLWGGFVFRTENLKVFFPGDTGYGAHFKEINEKMGAMDVSFLPIGAYEPRWFMEQQHMNPEEAVLAHKDLHSYLSIGTHFRTFQLTNEGIDQPVIDLEVALEKYNISTDKFLAPEPGTTFEFSYLVDRG
jgi:L-ascorbate metabolism protein UlaG (beta-lactamase superfamily)